MTSIIGIVTRGTGTAGGTLGAILSEISNKSGLAGLLPRTLNLQLEQPFSVVPDFCVRYQSPVGHEEYRFQKCQIFDLPCLIMRTSTNTHGDSVIEVMAEVQLRDALNLSDGDTVTVSISEPRTLEQ